MDSEWPDTEKTATEAPEGGLPSAFPFRGSDVAKVDAFADLPEEMQDDLALAAQVEALSADEEVAGFGAALVLEGEAAVCTTIVDTPIHRATSGTLVTSRGSLAEGVPLRVVAGPRGARVAVWDQTTIDDALRTCPWVIDGLREVADRMQACAGATIGPLGDLDDAALVSVLERFTLHSLQPDEQVVAEGHPMPGLVIVGGGAIDIIDRGEGGAPLTTGTLKPGDLLFASALLTGQPAPATARATSAGALLLVGEHPVLRSLFERAPALIAILNGEA
ncbi:MAG: cyclic nucleotide-binding domain-containing protein [Polyangiaceae bacterium]|nr:cyclic nucleotide-binding domain-containing protein [Polyangiaceae bacterium]